MAHPRDGAQGDGVGMKLLGVVNSSDLTPEQWERVKRNPLGALDDRELNDDDWD